MKRIVLFLSSFLLVGLFMVGGQSTKQVQAATQTYQIGTDVTYPPFEFANEQNQYVGIDIDIMKGIAKSEGLRSTSNHSALMRRFKRFNRNRLMASSRG